MQWKKILTNGPLARSSHEISLFGNKIISFGGENIPRTVIDSEILAFDLDGPAEWKVIEI